MLEAIRVVVGQCLDDGMTTGAVGTETVKDRLGEADLGGQVGIGMEGVIVARETVEKGLV